MDVLAAFAAALLALRLAGRLLARWRERRAPELAAWAASLVAYALAAAALTWGAAAGWDEVSFRLYYLCGGLLTAPLLGLGSLLLAGRRAALPATLVYAGLAVGVALAEPLAAGVRGDRIPDASEHLDFFPARLLAVLGNTAGTLAVVAVALATFRRRPLGNALVLAGVAVAAAGSGIGGLGGLDETATAAALALAAALLYAGFVAPPRRPRSRSVAGASAPPHGRDADRERDDERQLHELGSDASVGEGHRADSKDSFSDRAAPRDPG